MKSEYDGEESEKMADGHGQLSKHSRLQPKDLIPSTLPSAKIAAYGDSSEARTADSYLVESCMHACSMC